MNWFGTPSFYSLVSACLLGMLLTSGAAPAFFPLPKLCPMTQDGYDGDHAHGSIAPAGVTSPVQHFSVGDNGSTDTLLRLLRQAEFLCQQGDVVGALAIYQALEEQADWDGIFFVNEGICYHKAGQLPQAIACYRRALIEHPGDKELLRLLVDARKDVAANWPPISFDWPWEVSPAVVAGASLAFSGLGAGLVLLTLARSRWRRPVVQAIGPANSSISKAKKFLIWFFSGPGLVLSLGVLFVLSGGITYWYTRHFVEHECSQPVGVVTVEVTLLRGNGKSYPPVIWSGRPVHLTPGTEVRCLFQRKDWLQIVLQDGPVGWVPAASVYVPMKKDRS